MLPKICSIPECETRVSSRGWCNKHYRKWQRHGDPLGEAPKLPAHCSIDGCDRKRVSRGWCELHYLRWRNIGDVNWKPKERAELCKVPGCGGKHEWRELCSKHLYRLRTYGDPLYVAPPVETECSIEGCSKIRKARGWCEMHYKRWSVHGDPNHEVTHVDRGCSFDGCERVHKGHGLCDQHLVQSKSGKGLTEIVDRFVPDYVRFERHYEVTDSCWQWTGAIRKDGYVSFLYRGETMNAHRASFMIHVGEIPPGKEIDHRCRNRSCVNPEHLRIVTTKQNSENRATESVAGKSGYRGVHWHAQSGKWRAGVMHHGVHHYLGGFDDPAEAGEAARLKRLELFTHNDIDRRAS
ncbi:HNH endonuclease signature motif containing protein [Glutamicibacter bergerei]|nr:hypothetical protein [Micrococcaceae bacterium]